MDHEPIGRILSITYRAHHALVEEKLKELNIGVRSGQFFLLIALYHEDGVCQHELAEHYRIDKAAVARGIKILEDKDFVTKETSPEDQRRSVIRLTEKALQHRSCFFRMLEDIDERIKSYLTEEEITRFLEISDKIYRGLSEEIQVERNVPEGKTEADEAEGSNPVVEDCSGREGAYL
ncbi:MAG: MarR family winged helix-turn-helix transcriptional regulator [Spirochaetia bacterium]